MSKRTLIQRLDRLIEATDQRIERAVEAGKPIKRTLHDLKLLREVSAALKQKPQTVKSGPKTPITLGERARVDRELRIPEARIVKHIEAYPEHCFHLHDLRTSLKMPEKTLKNSLMRLVQDGFIARPRRGFYSRVRARKL